MPKITEAIGVITPFESRGVLLLQRQSWGNNLKTGNIKALAITAEGAHNSVTSNNLGAMSMAIINLSGDGYTFGISSRPAQGIANINEELNATDWERLPITHNLGDYPRLADLCNFAHSQTRHMLGAGEGIGVSCY